MSKITTQLNVQVPHQLLDNQHFSPGWSCRALVLGTFNPSGGARVNYFYGRYGHPFWEVISGLCGKSDKKYFHHAIADGADSHVHLMREKKFGCMDIIRGVRTSSENLSRIQGEGYSDQNLFNVGRVQRQYNFDQILAFIEMTPEIKFIINTVGERFDRPNPMELVVELRDFKNQLRAKNIDFISCPSASAYAVRRGSTKITDLEKLYGKYLLGIRE